MHCDFTLGALVCFSTWYLFSPHGIFPITRTLNTLDTDGPAKSCGPSTQPGPAAGLFPALSPTQAVMPHVKCASSLVSVQYVTFRTKRQILDIMLPSLCIETRSNNLFLNLERMSWLVPEPWTLAYYLYSISLNFRIV